MTVTKEQPYTPLDKKELREVEKACNKYCKGLTARVYAQLSQQEHNLNLQKEYTYKVNVSLSDELRDMADRVDTLLDIECNCVE